MLANRILVDETEGKMVIVDWRVLPDHCHRYWSMVSGQLIQSALPAVSYIEDLAADTGGVLHGNFASTLWRCIGMVAAKYIGTVPFIRT